VKSFYQPRSHPEAWSVNFNARRRARRAQVTTRSFDGRNWEASAAKLVDASRGSRVTVSISRAPGAALIATLAAQSQSLPKLCGKIARGRRYGHVRFGRRRSGASEAKDDELDPKKVRLVIGASSAGTVFEWYDFFIYGTLTTTGIIGPVFFPAGNETLQLLFAWATFAVGFGFRPLGAILFGYLGDKLGRKYTFLVTITLMGLATAGVGLIPSAASIGIAAPILLIFLRILQGLALGGEYGGAAIYVAEHSRPGKRGYYTSYIQASVAGGFVLSLPVVLLVRGGMGRRPGPAGAGACRSCCRCCCSPSRCGCGSSCPRARSSRR
jgi:small basic protein